MFYQAVVVGVLAVFCTFHLITPTSGDSAEELYSLADEFTSWWYDIVDSYNMSTFSARKTKADEFLRRLKEIDKKDMGSTDSLNYDLLQDMLQTYVDGYRWWRYGWLNPVSFMTGPQLDLRTLFDAPFGPKANLEDLISRIGDLKTRLAEFSELIREGIRLKRTYNAASLAKVPSQIDQLVTEDLVQFPMYKNFKESLESQTDLTADERENLTRRAAEVITDGILLPFNRFKQLIVKEYIPNARRAAGVHEWDQGREYYSACLRWHLSLQLTPEEVHDIGLKEVDRIAKQMFTVMRSQNFTGSIPEYFQYLARDPRFKLPSKDAIVKEYEHIVHDRINKKLGLLFRTLPADPVEVQGASVESGAGYYGLGVFYVNIMRPNTTNTFNMMALALHEANPGHHLQRTYKEDEGLPDFRYLSSEELKVPFAVPKHTAFVEGWALYAETLGEEMGLFKDQYELMGRYSSEMLRACRLVVDTGIHYKGWSRDDAIRYIMNYTSLARPLVEIEVDRYITFPGQSCAYKIGELKILELRRKAKAELGDHFDVKEFHSTILDLRAVPLPFMERAVEQMIHRVKNQQNSSGHSRVVFSPVTVAVCVLIRRALVFLV